MKVKKTFCSASSRSVSVKLESRAEESKTSEIEKKSYRRRWREVNI